MRNELAREYNLPAVDGAEVRLFFLENKIRNAWGVAIRSTTGPRVVYETGTTPRLTWAKAYSAYTEE